MYINYFIEVLNFFKLADGEIYFGFDGEIFDIRGRVDLRLYERGIDSITNSGGKRLRIGSLLNKEKMKEVEYPALREINLPLQHPGNKSEIVRFDEKFIFFSERDGNQYIHYCFNYSESLSTIILDAGILAYYDDSIIVQQKINKLNCYSWSGNQIWSFDIGRTSVIYRPNLMFANVGDGILFNAGELPDKSGAIVCLNKTTGKPIWRRDFDRRVENSFYIDGKIYLAIANRMMILEASDGGTDLEFFADIADTDLTALWSDKKLIYVIAARSNKILAYTLHGEYIRSYELPPHPVLKHGAKILKHDGVNYLGLVGPDQVLSGVEGGLLTWTPEDVLAGKELELEEKPFIISMVIKEDDGSQSYYLNIPCNNIHDVLRFGEIEARKVSALHGKQMWDNEETCNKKFNGQIKLIIEPAVGEENRVYLDMLAKRCTFFAKVMDIKSGNGKKPIEVSWAFSNEV
jgi:hypothetical protein